ncbi:hypothetical protein [Rhodobium gokarnense]|uniref:Class 3 adenylate cyclase n=1 Tax=Rhodobium gokarnense TaxID=364296 RepID=A0ABT3H5W7_9HYPH|nr:hypothetical protein [Rhodobium gokarnense]MCW2305783.1 class 3 adenylate cyclase [Rhodobium gokarnense]
MSVRPPSLYAPRGLTDPLTASIDREVMEEKAGTLGRLLRELEKRLKRLKDFEAELPAPHLAEDDPRRQEHAALIDAAGETLWYTVIQRDLCGFTRTDQFLKDMKVPKSVRLRMGVVARAAASK